MEDKPSLSNSPSSVHVSSSSNGNNIMNAVNLPANIIQQQQQQSMSTNQPNLTSGVPTMLTASQLSFSSFASPNISSASSNAVQNQTHNSATKYQQLLSVIEEIGKIRLNLL